MKTSLKKKEVICLCNLIKKDIPLIVTENFTIFDKWQLKTIKKKICDNLFAGNILKKDNDNIIMTDNTNNIFNNILSADNIVSVLNNRGASECAIYYSKNGISIINKIGGNYEFDKIDDLEASFKLLINKININDIGCDDPIEIVDDAQTIDDILSNKKKDYPEEKIQTIKNLFKIFNFTSCKTIITERIQKKGSIVSLISKQNGVVYKSIIYSEDGDIIVIGKETSNNAIKTVLNFRGK